METLINRLWFIMSIDLVIFLFFFWFYYILTCDESLVNDLELIQYFSLFIFQFLVQYLHGLLCSSVNEHWIHKYMFYLCARKWIDADGHIIRLNVTLTYFDKFLCRVWVKWRNQTLIAERMGIILSFHELENKIV